MVRLVPHDHTRPRRARSGEYRGPTTLPNLLGIDAERLRAGPNLSGPLLETFAVLELLKLASWSEQRPAAYHFRTSDAREVDLVLETPSGELAAVEVKASATVSSGDFHGIRTLAGLVGNRLRWREPLRGALHTALARGMIRGARMCGHQPRILSAVEGEPTILHDMPRRCGCFTCATRRHVTVTESDRALTRLSSTLLPQTSSHIFAEARLMRRCYQRLAEKESLVRPQPEKQFVSGEGFYYLGRSYRLAPPLPTARQTSPSERASGARNCRKTPSPTKNSASASTGAHVHRTAVQSQ
jgi:hypothetical protein